MELFVFSDLKITSVCPLSLFSFQLYLIGLGFSLEEFQTIQTVNCTNRVKWILYWCLDICRLLLAFTQWKQRERVSPDFTSLTHSLHPSKSQRLRLVCTHHLQWKLTLPCPKGRLALALGSGSPPLTNTEFRLGREKRHLVDRGMPKGECMAVQRVAKCQHFI